MEDCGYCEGTKKVFEVGRGTIVPPSVIEEAATRVSSESEDVVFRAARYFGVRVRKQRCPLCKE